MSAAVPWRPLLIFGTAVVGAFIIDSSVSNWSALDLTDVLGSTESIAALAYAAYALFMLIGRVSPIVWCAVRGAMDHHRGRTSGCGGLADRGSRADGGGRDRWLRGGRPGHQSGASAGFRRRVAPRSGNTGIAVARVNIGNYIGFVVGAPLVR